MKTKEDYAHFGVGDIVEVRVIDHKNILHVFRGRVKPQDPGVRPKEDYYLVESVDRTGKHGTFHASSLLFLGR